MKIYLNKFDKYLRNQSLLQLKGYEMDDACSTTNYCINDGLNRGMWKLIAPKCVPKRKFKC